MALYTSYMLRIMLQSQAYWDHSIEPKIRKPNNPLKSFVSLIRCLLGILVMLLGKIRTSYTSSKAFSDPALNEVRKVSVVQLQDLPFACGRTTQERV
ncbi:hypothetical protein HanHA300_Chr02g0043901 [Helianthus annuus]|nr:hypothetical protein HanHA300_Chr02g0043901 [Helianthus annuus]KAJ0617933.1 hypothetical protein HanHA89_Chr02g0047381 [Helianthus annuus]